MNNTEDQLRYPIGKFSAKAHYTAEDLHSCLHRIEGLPALIVNEIKDFTPQQLDTPYREGGWTARQVLHHLADSHMNAYIRFKWTLTEETPLIKAYDEKAWAETPEISLDPVISVELLKALHTKWVALLKLLSPGALKKTFIHPETKKSLSLEHMMALYAWHGEHHLHHLKIIAAKG